MVSWTLEMCSTKLIIVGTVLVLLKSTECAFKTPSWAKPCRNSDGTPDECILRRLKEAQPNVIAGFPKYRIPSLDPLKVTQITLGTGNQQVGLSLMFSDVLVHGLRTVDVYKTKVDLEKGHCILYWRNPTGVNLIGQYVMDGKILVLPIKGSGDGNITMKDLSGDYSFNYELVKKNNKRYGKITTSKMNMNVGKAYFKFQNLFNGDRVLGEQMNNFMNENYAEVVREFRPAIENMFNVIQTQLIQNIIDMASFEDIFPDIFK
uniref:Protein takeout n=1 Tax=Cacopsylla melanoneura TaxID=428564 RepID=A0A8D8Q441_9HEMI